MRNKGKIMEHYIVLEREEKRMNYKVSKKQEQQVIQNLLDGIRTYAYIVGETYTLSYINKYFHKFLPDAKVNGKCYEEIWGRKKPCPFCPMREQNAHLEIFHEGIEKKLAIDMVKVHNNGEVFHVFTAVNITNKSFLTAKEMSEIDPNYGIQNQRAFCKAIEKFRNEEKGFQALLLHMKKAEFLIKQFGRQHFQAQMKLLIEKFGQCFESHIYSINQGQVLAIITEQEEEFKKWLQWISDLNTSNVRNQKETLTLWDSIVISDSIPEKSCALRLECAELYFHKLDEIHTTRTVFMTQNLLEEIKKEKILGEVVLRAVNENRFIYAVQMIVDVETQKHSGCEILARLHDEKLGWISPTEFVPILEKLGRLDDLTIQIIEKVLRGMENKELPCLHVHINVPPVVMVSQRFFEKCREWKKRYPESMSYVGFELTENQSISLMYMQQAMHMIERLGFSIAIDDFGAGYSNINYLVDLPISIVKLDKKLIDRLSVHVSSQIMVESLIKMAHNLGIEVIAEGVETQEQYELLRKLHCDSVQGYLFSRPVLMEEIKGAQEERMG